MMIVLPVPTAEASTPEPTTFSAAISRWRPSSTGSSASGRASVIRTTCRAPADERHLRPRALERAQLADRLLGDHPPGGRRHAVGGRDRQHPRAGPSSARRGRVSFSCPAASVESSSGSPASTAVCTASPRSITALGCAYCSSRGADPSRRWVNPRAGNVSTRSSSSAVLVPSAPL